MEVLDRKKIITQDVMLENVKKLDKTFNYKNVYGVIKRSLDVTLSAIALITLSPIFLIIAAIIKLDSKGPVFFIHKRIGKDGKEIGIYKFRSMVQNAEDMIAEFTEEQKKEFRENYKLQDDPRVTKIGKILRKTSLDELMSTEDNSIIPASPSQLFLASSVINSCVLHKTLK